MIEYHVTLQKGCIDIKINIVMTKFTKFIKTPAEKYGIVTLTQNVLLKMNKA